jgi:hypothetical protein
MKLAIYDINCVQMLFISFEIVGKNCTKIEFFMVESIDHAIRLTTSWWAWLVPITSLEKDKS